MNEPPATLTVHPRPEEAPALLYVHSDAGAVTRVDQAAPPVAREHTLCRALLVHALALLDAEGDGPC
ncbi:hypothetical protein RM572_00720 [Streptomyces sp. DSM 42041]|uniref:Uncharacterized protein n=1 Tax=Streptomyces hazeniae TaxID=3075538 RepID=A0ABU2NNS1_9ACTN|nr:hypothetical protein [Streptomyces sp. DSM 42041]MDT0377298.1 hypothetical protein [Streptomyces sp. DSM 42041]